MREGFFIPNIFLKFATCNKSNWKMKIHTAKKDLAADIAQLIMMAMTDECCLYFTGDGQTTDDFRRTMTRLVEMEESQYSYTNTLVAETDEGRLMGVCVSYDGESSTSCARRSSMLQRKTSAGTSAISTTRRRPENCISTVSPFIPNSGATAWRQVCSALRPRRRRGWGCRLPDCLWTRATRMPNGCISESDSNT